VAFINPDIFRQYDIRGVADRDLTPEVAELLGRAFGAYLREHGGTEVIVGRDNRISSVRLRDNLVQGLAAAGCRVVDVGQVVTPMVYFARVHTGIDGALMITGSHKPPDENGFKISRGAGTIYGEEIQRLRALMEKGEFASGEGTVEKRDVAATYLAMLREKIRLGPRRLKVAVLWWCFVWQLSFYQRRRSLSIFLLQLLYTRTSGTVLKGINRKFCARKRLNRRILAGS